MHISSISLVADDDERYACKKDSDGWVWVYVGDISLLVKPQHVEHLVHLRDALNEILEGVPVPDDEAERIRMIAEAPNEILAEMPFIESDNLYHYEGVTPKALED